MTQLLQGSGAGTRIPYLFLPGNHEVRRLAALFEIKFRCKSNLFKQQYLLLLAVLDAVCGSDPLHGVTHSTSQAPSAIWSCVASCACLLLEHSSSYASRGLTLPAAMDCRSAGAMLEQRPRPAVMGRAQIERDEQLRTFQAYTNRFRHPYEASYSTSPLYYSVDVGAMHIIMLNAVRCLGLKS